MKNKEKIGKSESVGKGGRTKEKEKDTKIRIKRDGKIGKRKRYRNDSKRKVNHEL